MSDDRRRAGDIAQGARAGRQPWEAAGQQRFGDGRWGVTTECSRQAMGKWRGGSAASAGI